jgi:hypothetical protein
MEILNFVRGVRTKFRANNSEEVVIITAGLGIIATEKEKMVVTQQVTSSSSPLTRSIGMT